MRVKLYRAASMSAAMALIRAELGPEAMILGTRRVADGIEITAALEIEEPGLPGPAAEGGHDAMVHAPDPVTGGVDPSDTEVIDDSFMQPTRAGAPASRRRDQDRSARQSWASDDLATDRQAGPRDQPASRSEGARPQPDAGAIGRARQGQAAEPVPPRSSQQLAAVWRPPSRDPDGSGPAPRAPDRLETDAFDSSRRDPDRSAPATARQTPVQVSRLAVPGVSGAPASPAVHAAQPGAWPAAILAASTKRPERARLHGDSSRPAPSGTSKVPPPRSADDDAARRLAALAWHGVPPAMAGRLAAGPLTFALSITLRFAALDLDPGGPPLIFAGPPGAGKTLTTARLATRLVLAGCKPLVITADGRRAGATEQLAAFTRLLGLHLLVASTPAALQRALARRVDGEPVLIDAPGMDPFVPVQIEELASLAESVAAVTALVCPAGLDPNEAADLAAIHHAHGATLLVANRLDSGRRLGSVLAAAGVGLALSEAGIGPGASDGLVPLTPQMLAARLTTFPDSSA